MSIREAITELLARIPDPEIPVINIVELGIVRVVEDDGGSFIVQVTPTYSGCPATEVIFRNVHTLLDESGFGHLRVESALSPPWTTDWMTPGAKEKLRQYGISPPCSKADDELVLLPRKVECPYCTKADTELQSEFGSTPCKSFYICRACGQTFEHFKSI